MNNHPNSMIDDDDEDQERLIPVGPPLYSKIIVPDDGDHSTTTRNNDPQHVDQQQQQPPIGHQHQRQQRQQRRDYYFGMFIQHPSPMYRWKVYIGDIVAISMADHSKNKDGHLSQEEIEEWYPNHLKTKSPHWKIGLVVALSHTNAVRNSTNNHENNNNARGDHNYGFECHVEWLEKALDTPEFLKNKKLVQSYRPYTKENVKFKLPHVLLRTYSYDTIHPANILPVQITLLTDADFKDGVLWDPDRYLEDRFSFKMHCPKFITTTTTPVKSNENNSSTEEVVNTPPTVTFQPDPCMDLWPELNHYSFVKKSSTSSNILRQKQQQQAQQQQLANGDSGTNHPAPTKPTKMIQIPRPLQQAWAKWAPIQDDDNLLLALMKGFESSYGGKIQEYRNFKNRQLEEARSLEEEEQRQQEQRQAGRTTAGKCDNTNQKGKKRSAIIEPSRDDDDLHQKGTKKRVRVTINGATPLAGPTKSKGMTRMQNHTNNNVNSNNNNNSRTTVKSILKTGRNKENGIQPMVVEKSVELKPLVSTKRGPSLQPKVKKTLNNTGKRSESSTTHAKTESSTKSVSPTMTATTTTTTTTTSTTSSAAHVRTLAQLSLSQTQRSMTIDTLAQPIHRGIHQGERYEFYDRVTLTLPTDSNTDHPRYRDSSCGVDLQRVIMIGQVVAVVKEEDSMTRHVRADTENLLKGPWGVAQILALYRLVETGIWIMQVRWLSRFVEVSESVQHHLSRKKFFDESQGLLETLDVGISFVQAIMPVEVVVSMTKPKGKLLKELSPIGASNSTELPILHLQCRYLQEEDGSIVLKNDWDDYLASSSRGIRGPLARGLGCMNLNIRVKQKYEEALCSRLITEVTPVEEVQDEDETDESSMEEDSSIQTVVVEPLSEKPIFERWGAKFHDGVRVAIDSGTLDSSFSPETTQWTVKVGYVVPVAYHVEEDGNEESAKPQRKRKKHWFPFICSWCPAQIVSLYEDEQGTWKMQIRWLYRFDDLPDEQQEDMRRHNKPHVVFETESYADVDVSCCLPGRVVLSSSNCDSWEVVKSTISGIPFIPRLCLHIFFDDHVQEAADWTNYDVLLPSYPRPLSRGMLLDPHNRTNKDRLMVLARRYKTNIRLRGCDPEDLLLKTWEGHGPALLYSNVDSVEFRAEDVGTRMGDVWYTHNRGCGGDECVFSRSLSVNMPLEYIAVPSKAMRKSKFLTSTLNVGDLVAFHTSEAAEQADYIITKHLRHPWFPFRVSWSYGQIMTIYYEESAESKTPLSVGIRRFYRPSEIMSEHRVLMPPTEDNDREEVFESDSFIDAIPASSILGPCELFLGKHERSCRHRASTESESLISCRSRFFYHSSLGRFQPIQWTGLTPESWWKRLLHRGTSLSAVIRDCGDLQERMMLAFSDDDKTLDVRDLLGGNVRTQLGGHDLMELPDVPRKFFCKATLLPNWEDVASAEIHFDTSSRSQVTWEAQVGSIVAVRSDNFQINEPLEKTFPFRVAWIPCHIVAIHATASAAVENLSFEIARMKLSPHSDDVGLPEVDSSQKMTMATVRYSDLFGPLVFVPRENPGLLDWGTVPKGIPFGMVKGSKLSLTELMDVISIDESHVADAVIKLLGSLSEDSSTGCSRAVPERDLIHDDGMEACTNKDPLFIDLSHRRVFYNECWVSPQVGLFERWTTTKPRVKEPWSVKTGDMVLIHCDGPKKFPLKCNWGVAEVIAIWKEYENRDHLEKGLHSSDPNHGKAKLQAEIRWFYDRSEVAGLSRTESIDDSNEVFETDDACVLDDLTTILAPASLYSDPDDVLMDSKTFLNFPVQAFLCRRFWSTSRRSLIPCGALDRRESRARLYSHVIPDSFPLQKHRKDGDHNIHDAARAPGRSVSLTWIDSVRAVMSKLSLRETSSGVYYGGELLIGREKEMTQLLSFFRAAIQGLPGPGGVRSSIFLAGPPGVGKTACIRSAIASLQSEQIRGELPAFHFISLNGMEMKHPFEAYVKLWESLTGKKHVGSHEKACQRLEYHFTNPKSLNGDDDRSVTVVLLDEIDYLVTEKQSVLYNFFDWPKRAASVMGGRRLVVVGISNTLNLTEQLMPSVQSRVGSEKIVFRAYGVTEATAILQKKISEASPDHMIFEKDAILFAAKKTAAMSGDIRKAFQISRSAAELLLLRLQEKDGEDYHETANKENASKERTVRIADVQKASRESFDSALVTAVSFSTSFQALLLISLASLRRSTGREVGGFDLTDILIKMESLSGSSGDPEYAPPPSFGETLGLLNRLAETGLIKVSTASSSSISFRSFGGGNGGAWPRTTLTVDDHTLIRGLNSTLHQKLVEKCLPML